MSKNLIVRPAFPSDLDACVSLVSVPELVLTTGDYMTSDYMCKYLNENFFLVAEEDEEIIGMLFSEPIKDSGCLVWAIAVAKNRRGQGIGSMLLIELQKRIVRLGLNWIILYGFADSEAALAFYQSNGFRKGIRCVEFVKEF